jgi:Dihydroxyacid dehydratase/phosphogluconate dehydratase
MAAATVNIPAIVLSGGPMLDGVYKGKISWNLELLFGKQEKLLAKGKN